MKKLSPLGIKSLRFLHICFTIMWGGGTMALLVLVGTLTPETGNEQKLLWEAACSLDKYLITPGAMACLLSGLLFSIFSNWGFFKHGWVSFKWGVTIGLILFGTFVLAPWLYGNMRLTQDVLSITTSQPTITSNSDSIIFWGGFQLVCLVMIIAVSIFKPKKQLK